MEELVKLDQNPLADGTDGRRLELQQEVQELEQRIEMSNVKTLDYLRAKLRRDDVENRMGLHFELKGRTTGDIRQVELDLRAIKEEQERQRKQRRWLEINEEKFKLYHTMVNDVEKSKVMKSVMYWQSIINYILYSVFILNLFITTFNLLADED